jgi:hypothetical protein
MVLALLLAVHGVAHLVGFVTAWELRNLPAVPFHTTVLGGLIDVGRSGARLVGVGWLLAAIAFAVVAAGLVARRSWWLSAAYGALGFSLILCLLGWPDSRIGVAVNAGLLALLAIGSRLDWLPLGSG